MYDDQRGTLSVQAGGKTVGQFTLEPPDAPGDGTVPAESASPVKAKATFCAGLNSCTRDHAATYVDQTIRDITLYSVVQLVAQKRSP